MSEVTAKGRGVVLPHLIAAFFMTMSFWAHFVSPFWGWHIGGGYYLDMTFWSQNEHRIVPFSWDVIYHPNSFPDYKERNYQPIEPLNRFLRWVDRATDYDLWR